MMQVGIRKAKNELSRLIEAALSGESVIITNRGKPSVRLVPERPKPAKNRGFGYLKGLPDAKLYPGWDSAERETEFTELFLAESRRKEKALQELLSKSRLKKPRKKK
jgi:prevent-host-death family protein